MFTVKTLLDYSFTCPSVWTDGTVENLRCVIPRAKFSAKPSGGLCDIYADTVVFTLNKSGVNPSTACMVTGFDTTCDGSVNVDGCGCREISGGNIVVDYNITAVLADHEGAHWECVPQCLDSAGYPVLLSPNTTECFNTVFSECNSFRHYHYRGSFFFVFVVLCCCCFVVLIRYLCLFAAVVVGMFVVVGECFFFLFVCLFLMYFISIAI